MKSIRRFITPAVVEGIIIIILLGISAYVHGHNMLHYPYFENDEGSYYTRAWTFLSQGTLDEYTFWYDHAPLGSMLASLWILLTGGLFTFGFALNSARVAMLLIHIASTWLLFKVTKRMTDSIGASVIACLFFSLSPLAVYFQRRFLLDNILVFFILLSLYFILYARKRLSYFIFSALSFGVAVLCKENAIFFFPAFVWLIVMESHEHNKLFVITKWIAISCIIISFYPLYALLKGELFPMGSILAPSHEHVSLLGTLKMQASRGAQVPFWKPNSDFMTNFFYWFHTEPFIIVLGFLSFGVQGVFSIFSHRSRKVYFVTLSIMLFFLSGKLVINFYIIALIPFLAMSIGLTIEQIFSKSYDIHPAIYVLFFTTVVGYIVWQYSQNGDLRIALTRNDTTYQLQAVDWVKKHVDPQAHVIIDHYANLDLWQSRYPGDPSFTNADWYWKLDFDPQINNGKFHNDFRNVQYIMLTNQMFRDLSGFDPKTSLLRKALANSTLVQLFGPDTKHTFQMPRYPKTHPNGDWVAVMKQNTPVDILQKTWTDFAAVLIQNGKVGESKQISARDQGFALFRAVIANDRQTFNEIYNWTSTHMMLADKHLFATVYDNDEGKITNKGTTTEADEYIALSLALAYNQWKDERYRDTALLIINDIWKYETTTVRNTRYVTAGDWTLNGSTHAVSPSSLMPFAYRIFNKIDTDHDWEKIVKSSYELLTACTEAPLGYESSAYLPPNWCTLTNNETVTAATSIDTHASDYSYDAPRTVAHISLDYMLNPTDAAKAYLQHMTLWKNQWDKRKDLYGGYTHDGAVLQPNESMTQYGIMLGYFSLMNRQISDQLYYTKIAPTVINDGNRMFLSEKNNIYDQHWLWFGMAFYTGLLRDRWYNN